MSFSIPYQTKNEQKPEKNLKVSARKLLYILFAHTTLFHKYTSVFGFAVRKWGSGKMSIHKKIAKSLKSGLKSVFFAVMSVTFSHQYHTLHMARYLDMNVGVRGNISSRFNCSRLKLFR